MAQYSPPSRNYPQELPDYWRFEDGTVRRDLQTLTDAELEALGWHGPITMPEDIPNTSSFTHNYTWNSDTLSFDVEEVDQYEKQRRVDYKLFWDYLVDGHGVESIDENGNTVITTGGVAYQKIKTAAKTSLEVNVMVTEFIALLSDAKIGKVKVEKIQECLSEILSTVTFSNEEFQEIQKIFTESGMFSLYTLS